MQSAIKGLLAALIMLGGCTPLQPVPSQPAGDLRILAPLPGAVVRPGEQLDIVAWAGTGAADARVYANADGAIPLMIASGDLRTSGTSDLLQTAWTIGDTPPGSYTISVHVGGRVVEVPVEVRLQPYVAIRLVEADRANGTVVAHFEADVTASGRAIGYAWTVEDARIVETTGRLAYAFRGTDRQSTVTVQVRTDDGGGGFDAQTFEIAFNPPQPPARPVAQRIPPPCGCSGMTVSTQNVSGVYCLPGQQPPANIPFCRLANAQEQQQAQQNGLACRQGANMFVCPLGVSTPPGGANNRLGFGFEVTADLIQPSIATQCTEGQLVGQTTVVAPAQGAAGPLVNPAVQATPAPGVAITLPRAAPPPRVVTPVGNPQNLPPVPGYWGPGFQQGTAYGGDDYTVPGNLKVHEANRIRWFDFPSENMMPANGAINRAVLAYRFLAFVLGNTGNCWCEFDIQYQWTRGGNPAVINPPQPPGVPARQNIIRMLDGFNCQVR